MKEIDIGILKEIEKKEIEMIEKEIEMTEKEKGKEMTEKGIEMIGIEMIGIEMIETEVIEIEMIEIEISKGKMRDTEIMKEIEVMGVEKEGILIMMEQMNGNGEKKKFVLLNYEVILFLCYGK